MLQWQALVAGAAWLVALNGAFACVTIHANQVVGGDVVDTVEQLQRLLDSCPGGIFNIRNSRWTVSNQTIMLRSNRSLIMDASTVITGIAELPWTKHGAGEVGEGGGALLTVSGNNISVAGGRFEQEILPACAEVKTQPIQGACNFAIDIYYSSGITLRDSVIQGSFMTAVRVQESIGWPAGIKPGMPPVASKWVTLPGIARQPVLITNVTLLHHRNQTFFQLRGFWTVMTANVIFARNTILGPFGYAIDLDSSSSGNLVTNNYMKGCLWEGIFTEYSAVHNVITGNKVVANCTYDQAIHINGELNIVVDNTVLRLDGTPAGIACTSQLSMYNSYALSNRIVGNTCGHLALGGDGGCDNYAADNTANVSIAGATLPTVTNWFRSPNQSICIAGTDTIEPAKVKNTGSKLDPPHTITIIENRLQPNGARVDTVAQLQALLDANPNTGKWSMDTSAQDRPL
jgi:parallel beta-helix repeat protein